MGQEASPYASQIQNPTYQDRRLDGSRAGSVAAGPGGLYHSGSLHAQTSMEEAIGDLYVLDL